MYSLIARGSACLFGSIRRSTPAGAVAALLVVIQMQTPANAQSWTLESPGGDLQLEVRLDEPEALPQLSYRVLDGEGGDALLQWSPLGIAWQDQAFVNGLTLVSGGDVAVIDKPYTLIHGKERQLRDHARMRSLTFRNALGSVVVLDIRAYDDGVAFRYRFPGPDAYPRAVIVEATGFHIPDGARMWAQPFQVPGQYTPAYEAFFVNGVPVGTPSETGVGWAFPTLFELPDHDSWILVTEAGLDGSYSGTRLATTAPDNIYTIRFPEPAEGNGVGNVYPVNQLPFASPWRVVIAGSLNDVVQSSLVTHVSPPSRLADDDWVEPGRAAWHWWSSQKPSLPQESHYAYVDLAADMGWEFYLIDANWNKDGIDQIADIVAYARERDVDILLWYNSGGPHNVVTEEPRDRLYERLRRRAEFAMLRDLGVKGVKVDFFQSDKQDVMRYHMDILQDAADHELMVNFHGSTLPRGWQRTWPNLMTVEAVKGAEAYGFDPAYPETAPWHNTILPFTRNVVGPMDYTPVTFSDNNYPRITTDGHEMALSVLYESGWQHYADYAGAYCDLKQPAKEFLADVPAVWDEVQYLAGEPGSHVVLARRNGETWYVAGISGENQPVSVDVPLAFLDSGTYAGTRIGDGDGDRDLEAEALQVSEDDVLNVDLRPRGGFVMKLEPSGR